jgi:hypothetical protein
MTDKLQFKGFRTVGWFIERVESLEDDFVQHLLQDMMFTRSGKEQKDYANSLTELECKLMDDILELKDWITEMREEERALLKVK